MGYEQLIETAFSLGQNNFTYYASGSKKHRPEVIREQTVSDADRFLFERSHDVENSGRIARFFGRPGYIIHVRSPTKFPMEISTGHGQASLFGAISYNTPNRDILKIDVNGHIAFFSEGLQELVESNGFKFAPAFRDPMLEPIPLHCLYPGDTEDLDALRCASPNGGVITSEFVAFEPGTQTVYHNARCLQAGLMYRVWNGRSEAYAANVEVISLDEALKMRSQGKLVLSIDDVIKSDKTA